MFETILFMIGIGFMTVSVQDPGTRDMVHESFVVPLLERFEKTDFRSKRNPSTKKTTKGIIPSWKFANFDVERWNENQRMQLKHSDAAPYFVHLPHGEQCFKRGTDIASSISRNKCQCLQGYFGSDCGIPAAAWYGHFKGQTQARKALRPRSQPRRIIHGVLVNHEFDFLEARIRSLADVVDVFVVQESNFTTFGTVKSLAFLERFQRGWLKDHQDKILYTLLPYFHEKAKTNGWYADGFIRMYMSKKALPMIEGSMEDDLFLLLDADELPNPEVLLFLKLYEGYTEPIKLGFRWTVFGFYWLKAQDPSILAQGIMFLETLLSRQPSNRERLLELSVICTLGMLSRVYSNNAMLLRRNVYKDPLLADALTNYSQTGHGIQEWTAGTLDHYAGFHCSWCYSPQGIRTKLLSAQQHDKPRWGDYPEKTNVSYISGLIQNGQWFDGTKTFIRVDRKATLEQHYAPSYILEHARKFDYLLRPPKRTDDR
eukprot:snap_masked-scaffold217_size252476-processed-gene-1.4 protein:Tk00459 transcript:snap_masked-scaffold217_size252476-processed-gene-1.4-mRNA-1 annotation:"hypothetical protein DAPPUDRAFT_50861"